MTSDECSHEVKWFLQEHLRSFSNRQALGLVVVVVHVPVEFTQPVVVVLIRYQASYTYVATLIALNIYISAEGEFASGRACSVGTCFYWKWVRVPTSTQVFFLHQTSLRRPFRKRCPEHRSVLFIGALRTCLIDFP